jgi:hypothetical protein
MGHLPRQDVKVLEMIKIQVSKGLKSRKHKIEI